MANKLHPLVTPSGKPKLLDQVRHEMRVRHMAFSTERLYVNWIRRFILFHHKRHPAKLGKAEVSEFLTYLAVNGKVTSSTQNQALSALLFLYRHVLEQEGTEGTWNIEQGMSNDEAGRNTDQQGCTMMSLKPVSSAVEADPSLHNRRVKGISVKCDCLVSFLLPGHDRT